MSDPEAAYELYIFDISYFSGKMEAYLRYKEIPYTRIEPTWWQLTNLILPNTGLMKVPVVRTVNGVWLKDSTPMIDWFESKHPRYAILPDDPVQRFFSRLLEDYADEWLWRPALHYRWSYRNDNRLNIERFLAEFLRDIPMPKPVVRWLTRRRQDRVYVSGDGVDKHTRRHTESIYLNTLDRLQAVFEMQPFLLGDKPSLADFGFFASMFRHFSIDPTPARLMRDRAPAVYEWVARMWNVRGADYHYRIWHQPGELPDCWAPIVADVGRSYLPYLHANAVAFKEGRRTFNYEVEGVVYRQLPVVPYRVWCREQLQRRTLALDAAHSDPVRRLLVQFGCWEPLWRDGSIQSSYHAAGETPPICKPRRVGVLERVQHYFTGTSW